jgi:5-methylcytosine-specific restriction endonuclease McrA
VHAYLLRTSGSYLRKCVRLRDKGVCAGCKLDCVKLRREYRKALAEDPVKAAKLKKQYPRLQRRRSYWEADHIVEVVNGGGSCGLENLQTLCTECHLTKTVALNKSRKTAKR